MRKINKSESPASFQSFCQHHHTEWSEIHQPNTQSVYDDCLRECEKDQDGLCGYTEISLKETTMHIDHYVKRDFDNRLTFSWENMIAAVKDSRFGADWKDSHIKRVNYDVKSRRYDNILNPVLDDFEARFVFCTDGAILPKSADDTLAINTIEIFNLNEVSLKSRRKNIMQSVRSLIEGGFSKEEVLENVKTCGFLSAIEYELSKY